MTFSEMVLRRESCRAYADKPVSREDLTKIVEAGALAPSACNSQPWKFIVVDEAEAKKRLCDALVTNEGFTGAAFRDQVPAYIVLIEQPANVVQSVRDHYGDTQRFAQGDIGMAAMNMCYQATDLGLSTCVIGMNEQEKMEAALGIPAGAVVRLVLAVGYSAEDKEPRKKVRKPFDEVVSFNRW